jgi:hypothetical protein
MNKIRLVPILTFALLVVLIASCKKSNNDPSGGTGNTDLQVYVLDSDQQVVQGALVSLYTSASDRNAGTNVVGSQITGTSGFIYFSKISPLTYYVSVIKHSATSSTTETGNADTGVPIKSQEQTALTVVIQ